MAPPTSPDQMPLVDRLKKICVRLQFVWFLGHVLLVVGLPYLIFTHNSTAYYRALFGSMLSYGVVLWRSYESSVRTAAMKQTLMKMSRDVNAQYFMLSLSFYLISNPCLAVLVPYFSFSIFHVLGYFRDFFLPTLLPSSNFAGFRKSFNTVSTQFTNKFQPTAMDLASLWECAITPLWIVCQTVLFRQSLLVLILYGQFLLFRYVTSSATRASFAKLRSRGDQVFQPHLQAPTVMGKLATVYVYVRDYLSGFAEKLHAQFPDTRRGSTSSSSSSSSSTSHPHSK